MMYRICFRLLALGLLALLALTMVWASAASNTISGSHLGQTQRSVRPNDLKPPQCATQHVDNLITGSGIITGTSGDDLILGSPGVDVISGGGGDDCLVGGGGADTLSGDAGNDTCIGGPGTDILAITCERQVQ